MFLLPLLFWRISQPPGSPPKSFRVNLKNTFSHIFTDPWGICFSRKYLFNFLSNLYIPSWLRRFSSSWWSDYWKIHLQLRKKNQEIFIYMHRQNFPSRSYHHLPGRGRLLISQTAFFQKSIPTSTNRGRKLWECYSGWKFNKITNFCKLNSMFCISIER